MLVVINMELFNEFENKEDVRLLQPLVLAMVGDSVQTLFVRAYVAKMFGVKVNKMNKLVSSVVSAGAQFKAFKKIEPLLTEEEQDIARRARNSHIHTKAKNFSYNEYIYATAFEALIGYLYLTKQTERMNELLNISVENLDAGDR